MRDAKRYVKRQIDAVRTVLRRWDPIGVRPGFEAPANEYDTYAPPIVSMVLRGATVEEVADHLGFVQTGPIGLRANPEQDRVFAVEILAAVRNIAT